MADFKLLGSFVELKVRGFDLAKAQLLEIRNLARAIPRNLNINLGGGLDRARAAADRAGRDTGERANTRVVNSLIRARRQDEQEERQSLRVIAAVRREKQRLREAARRQEERDEREALRTRAAAIRERQRIEERHNRRLEQIARDRERRNRQLLSVDAAASSRNITTSLRSARAELERFNVLFRNLGRRQVENLERIRNRLSEALRRANIDKNTAEVRRLRNELARLEAQAENTNRAVRGFSFILDRTGGFTIKSLFSLRGLGRAFVGLVTNIDAVSAGLATLGPVLGTVTLGIGTVAAGLTAFGAATAAISFAVLRAGFSGLTSVIRGLLFPLTAVIESIRRLIQFAPLLATALAGREARNIIKTYASVSEVLTRARVTFRLFGDAGVEQFNRLKNAAFSAARLTIFTIEESARVLNSFAKSAFTVGESLRALRPTLDFSLISELDPDEAASLAAGILRQFDLDVGQLESVFSAIISGANQSLASVGEFARSFDNLGAIAEIRNVSLQETVGILSQLSSRGTPVEEAMTSVNISLRRIFERADEVNRILRPLGKQFADFTDDLQIRFEDGGFVDFLRTINQSEVAISQLQQLIGARGTRFNAIFLGEGAEELLRRIEQVRLDQQQNLARQQAQLLNQELSVQLRLIQSIASQIRFGIAAAFRGPIVGVVEALRAGLDRIREAVETDAFQRFADALSGGLGAAARIVGPLALNLVRISTILNTAITATLFRVITETGPGAANAVERVYDRLRQLTGIDLTSLESAFDSIRLFSLVIQNTDFSTFSKRIFATIGQLAEGIVRISAVTFKNVGKLLAQGLIQGFIETFAAQGNLIADIVKFIPEIGPGLSAGIRTASAAAKLFADQIDTTEDLVQSTLSALKDIGAVTFEELDKAATDLFGDIGDRTRRAFEMRNFPTDFRELMKNGIQFDTSELLSKVDIAGRDIKKAGEDAGRGIEDGADAISNQPDFRAQIIGLDQFQNMLATIDAEPQVAAADRNTDAVDANTNQVAALSSAVGSLSTKVTEVGLALAELQRGDVKVGIA